MKRAAMILVLAFSATFASAQESTPGELLLSSSVVCDMCKNAIEQGMAYTKGIKSTKVNVKENQILVKYNPEKLTEQEVKEAITALGYVAGDMKPTKAAYDKLHGCCKAEGVCD